MLLLLLHGSAEIFALGGWDGMGSRRLDTVESYESAGLQPYASLPHCLCLIAYTLCL